MKNSQVLEFLYQSIADTQATIKAVDVKVGFLFLITFMPLPGLEVIFKASDVLLGVSLWHLLLLVPVLLFWLCALVSLISCTIPISKPGSHVRGDKPSGSFYAGFLFRMNFIDNFLNFPIKSEISIGEFKASLPSTEDELISELSFEKMKLAYIRQIKIKRAAFCALMTYGWVIFGVIAWVIFLVQGESNVNG
ncbi:hypothetical protein [Idiomarina sp.]|uniref:hypothetical protein n=1 Tax=Idiomarina sp. TaxID=1874361 RepID=UPI0035170398